MATVIKESFVEGNNHTEVIYQTDKPIADFELNEAQRIPRVNFQRLLEDAIQKVYSGEDFSPGSNDDGLKPTPGGADAVDFAAGSILMQGVRARVDASTVNMPAYSGGGTTTYVIYAKIEEIEVADPAALQTISELSRRRKLVITLLTATDGIVPTSSPLDLWEGGIHYEGICTVLRRTGDSTVLADDIVDLRRLLPSSVLTQIHRQKNFSVKAVVGPQFESADLLYFVSFASDVPVVPIHQQLLFGHYLGSTDAFGPGTEGTRYFEARYQNTGSSPRYRVDAGTGSVRGVFGSKSGSLGFADENVPAAEPINLSALGHGVMRLFEKEPAAADRRSLVGTHNARWAVTCGDGTSSFGDFSGNDAISDAFAYFLASVYGATTAICHLKVKAGIYTLATTLTVPAGVVLILEGEAGADALFGASITYEPPSLFDAAIVVEAQGVLRVDKCLLSATKVGAAYTLAISSAGDVHLTDCAVHGSVATGAHTVYGVFKRQVGFRAENTHFLAYANVVSDLAFCFAPAGSGTTPGQGQTQRVCHYFEKCTFKAATRGSIIDVRGNLATQNYIDEIKFVDCMFEVAHNHTTDSPAGILTCYSTSTNGGYMTVQNVIFEDCRVARNATNKASPIVFDLRASNATDSNGVGVYFEHIHMRNCDWRVLEDATRIHAPWHLGQNSPAGDIPLATSNTHSIRRLTIEDTLFGFLNDGTNPDFTNAYGYHRGELSTSPYRAALSLHAENIVIREVEFVGAMASSGSAELFLPGLYNILVDGLRINLQPSAGINLPPHRLIAYARIGNERIDRSKYSRVFRRVFLFAPFTTTITTSETGMVSVIPGGNMVWEDCFIQGGDTDTGFCIDPLEDGPLAVGGGDWDYSGFVLRKSTLAGLAEGFRLNLPHTGDVSQIEQIELDGLIFNDVGNYFFNVKEIDPEESAEYHTRIQMRVVDCLARYVSGEGGTPECKFYAGRPWNAAIPGVFPYNLWMQGNNFGTNSVVTLGANGSIFTDGLAYFVTDNCFSVSLWQYDSTSLAKTFGLHTGYGSVGTAMNGSRNWTDGQIMLANSGLLSLLVLCH